MLEDSPQAAGLLRCGKSCRLRWINYLRPDVKRGNFTEDEEDLIIKLHALLGNRWSLIAGRLPGRTDNEVKNYWNSHLRRKLMNMGIDPNNHRLSQGILRPQNTENNTSSGATSFSGAKVKKPYICKPVKSTHNDVDQVSDAGSCLEDDPSPSLPDLNLHLTITTIQANNSHLHKICLKDEDTKQNEFITDTSRDNECPAPPTLFLFR